MTGYYYRGEVTGDRARKFPEFIKVEPIWSDIEHVFHVDPERLHPAEPYPRSTNPPSESALRHRDVVSWSAEFNLEPGTGGVGFHLILLPLLVWHPPRKVVARATVRLAAVFTEDKRQQFLRQMLSEVFDR